MGLVEVIFVATRNRNNNINMILRLLFQDMQALGPYSFIKKNSKQIPLVN